MARNVNGDIKYYITDHLHSTAMFVDKAGTAAAVLDDNDFYPWGGVVPGIGKATSNNTIKFTGKYRDTESVLDYSARAIMMDGLRQLAECMRTNERRGAVETQLSHPSRSIVKPLFFQAERRTL